jgi:hypothetical protein
MLYAKNPSMIVETRANYKKRKNEAQGIASKLENVQHVQQILKFGADKLC